MYKVYNLSENTHDVYVVCIFALTLIDSFGARIVKITY